MPTNRKSSGWDCNGVRREQDLSVAKAPELCGALRVKGELSLMCRGGGKLRTNAQREGDKAGGVRNIQRVRLPALVKRLYNGVGGSGLPDLSSFADAGPVYSPTSYFPPHVSQ